MAFRCLDEGSETLGPHLSHWAGIVHEAFAEVYRKYGDDFHELEAWTKAGIIRDKIVARFRTYCEERSGLHPIRERNASYFGIDSKFLVKVKKFGAGFRVNLPQTGSANLFDTQTSPLQDNELFESLDPTTVYVGYVPTENAPLSPPVFVVCKNDEGKVAWFIECEPPEPPPVIELEPTAPSAPPARVRVKVKKSDKSGTDG